MELEKVKISPDGPSFSPIIYGTMTWGHWGHKLDREGMEKLIKSSLDWGITTFDHADIYGDYTNEADFGRVLKREPSLRDRIELITKCGICRKCKQRPEYQIHHYNTSKEHIEEWKKEIRMMMEEDAVFTKDGVRYIDGRQTELFLIPEQLPKNGQGF
jgi:predicted oxidoreductase